MFRIKIIRHQFVLIWNSIISDATQKKNIFSFYSKFSKRRHWFSTWPSRGKIRTLWPDSPVRTVFVFARGACFPRNCFLKWRRVGASSPIDARSIDSRRCVEIHFGRFNRSRARDPRKILSLVEEREVVTQRTHLPRSLTTCSDFERANYANPREFAIICTYYLARMRQTRAAYPAYIYFRYNQ